MMDINVLSFLRRAVESLAELESAFAILGTLFTFRTVQKLWAGETTEHTALFLLHFQL